MKYAVVKISGKQYKVSEGDEILVDKIVGKLDPAVLLTVDGEKVKVGNPTVRGAEVGLTVVEPEIKGKKVIAATYKAKARIRKTKGMRPLYSRVKIGKIAV